MRKSLKIFILSVCWGQGRSYRTIWTLTLTLALTATAVLFSIAVVTLETQETRSWAARGIMAGGIATILAWVATMCVMFICAIEDDRMGTCLSDARGAAASTGAAWPNWEEGVHPRAGPYRRTRRNGAIIGIYARDDTPACSVAVIHGDTMDYTSHVKPEQAPALALRRADETAGKRDRKREKGRKKETRRELKTAGETARTTARDDRVREQQSVIMDRLRQATQEQTQSAAQS